MGGSAGIREAAGPGGGQICGTADSLIGPRVNVEAAAIIDSRCVRVRCVCGELWGKDANQQVEQQASELVRQLESGLADAALEITAGLYDD